MKTRSWNNAYKLGIPMIDRQHEQLFNIYDKLVSMYDLEGRAYNEEIQSILHELEDYFKAHFKAEEELLKKSDYPDIEAHILEHESFIRRIDQFVLSYRSDNPSLGTNMLDFLKKWLVTHIMQTDLAYKEFVTVEVN